MKTYLFESQRLGFRYWEDEDAEFYSLMLSNPEVMRYFPNKPLTLEESIGEMYYKDDQLRSNGYGFWAVEIKETQTLIGQIGLQDIPLRLYCAPAIEIGWRLDRDFWYKGFASEGAKRLLQFAKENHLSDSIVAYTAQLNLSSQSVMKKIGMNFEATFEHPELDNTHPLCQHVLYRIHL